MPEKDYSYLTLLRVILPTCPRRAILGGTLMITQSFLYNAIFFTTALVLTKFYRLRTQDALGNWGRKPGCRLGILQTRTHTPRRRLLSWATHPAPGNDRCVARAERS
jgi:hypothetical protein